MKKPNAKKKTSRLLLPLLGFVLVGMATGCSASSDIVGIHMTDPETHSIYYGNFSYEGISVTVDFRDGSFKEIPLEEEMISEIERLKFFKMGPQEVEVVFRHRYKTIMPIEVILNEFKDSYALVGYECTYDGNPHTVKLNQELPEGATIAYPYGNTFINAGSYEVTGVISKNGYASKTLKTTLTIHQAEHDTKDLLFEDATVVYNGEMQSILVQNVPEGVEVTYNAFDLASGFPVYKVVNAGTYRIEATFKDTSPNYAQIEKKEAILTIQKANYDISGVKFDNATRQYDGKDYYPAISGQSFLPTGLKPRYSIYDSEGQQVSYYDATGVFVPNDAKVGTYTMKVEFEGIDEVNYLPIEPLTATLKVSKRVIEIKDYVAFLSKTVDFDPALTVHSLAISGTSKGSLPEDKVSVRYENNDQIYAGEYEVKAIFEAKDPNETVDLPELTAYLIINRIRQSVKVKNETTGKYTEDFTKDNISVKEGLASVGGYDTSVFKVASIIFFKLIAAGGDVIDPKDFVVGTDYKYVVAFEYLDPDIQASVILSEESDIYTYEG